MERKNDIEKAWEQALGNIFQPYTHAPDERKKALDSFHVGLSNSSYDIRRHLARTAARQGSTVLNRLLADEYWGMHPR